MELVLETGEEMPCSRGGQGPITGGKLEGRKWSEQDCVFQGEIVVNEMLQKFLHFGKNETNAVVWIHGQGNPSESTVK